jgi:hypothetical protein
VGTLWLIKHTRPDNILSTPDNSDHTTPTTAGIRIKGGFTFDTSTFATGETVKLWRKEGNGSWQEYRTFSAATAYSADEDKDNVYYTFTRDKSGGSETTVSTLTAKNQINYGIVKVTAHSSTTVATVIVIDPVLSNNSSDAAVTTSMWAEGAFSIRRGYPRAIAMHENRLWYGGTTYQPQSIWGSRSSKFRDFTSGTLDDDSVQITIEDADVSQIQWLASEEVLLAGTAKKEYKISASNLDDPITPSDVRARSQSSHGSYHIQPVHLNNSIFYFQGLGQKLRLMRFNESTYRYESDDGTLLSNDMFESTPVQIAAQRIPDAVQWVVREDGTLCSFSYEPKEEVVGWSEQITGGLLYVPQDKFTSVAVIRGEVEDDIYVAVLRHVSGQDVYYIEKFAPRQYDQTDEALMMDSAKIVSSIYESKNVVYASDTIAYGAGVYGSGRYGGTD